MRNLIYAVLIIFLFNACSSKEGITVKNTISNNKNLSKTLENKKDIISEEDDDFDDEFNDEFEEEKKEVFDPLSGYNRLMTSFNDTVFINVLSPVAKGYGYVLPQTIRVGISNFFNNLLFPIRFTNNLLQLKFKNSAEELGRFVVNTTWGLGGFMDPAKNELGWKEHNEDFGQTLGYYGVGEGFHIVLPFLGPSNLRDMTGLVAASYMSPLSSTGAEDIKYKIPKNSLESYSITAVSTVNDISLKQGQYENIKKDAFDLYPFLRDIYNQKRKKEIEE